jgi:hypothetical protein
MPNFVEAPVTVSSDQQPDLIAMPSTTTPLPTPGQRRSGLLARLRVAIASCLWHRTPHTPRLLPSYPRLEPLVDTLARKHPYIYIKAMSG